MSGFAVYDAARTTCEVSFKCGKQSASPRCSAHAQAGVPRSEEHTSELQSQSNLVCRLLLEKKKEHECPRSGIVESSPLVSHASAPSQPILARESGGCYAACLDQRCNTPYCIATACV